MNNRDSLLGRSKPRERLTREEIAALDQETATPATPAAPPKPAAPPAPEQPPAKPPAPKNQPVIHKVRRDQLIFRWSTDCPACGFKVNGAGHPSAGQRLARCGRCKATLVLDGK